MDYKKETILLDSLLLDTENARHGDQDDQNAVLKWMASGKNREKVISLAQSIATHGFSPIEIPIVMPAADDLQQLYIVVEGNRRIAALKMLLDPDKCPDDYIKKKIRNLRQGSQILPPSELECIVFPGIREASYWIKLRHLGEQGGAGIVPWGAKESEYFAGRIGEPGRYNSGMRLLDYATQKKLISQEESNRIHITNVTRLINSPDIRNEIGLNIKKGTLTRVVDQDYFDRAITDMLRALASGGWTVSKLKHLEDRINFINQIKLEKGWGDCEDSEEVPISPGETEGETERIEEKPPETKKKQNSRDSLLRKTPISSSVSMKIQNKRLRSIFKELKTINSDDYVNAASVLTRVFIEGFIDLYINKNDIQLTTRASLADKARAVKSHIKSANIAKESQVKSDLKGLETFCGDPNSVGSANTFNAVVHNLSFSLTSKELKQNWNRLESCLPWFEGHV